MSFWSSCSIFRSGCLVLVLPIPVLKDPSTDEEPWTRSTVFPDSLAIPLERWLAALPPLGPDSLPDSTTVVLVVSLRPGLVAVWSGLPSLTVDVVARTPRLLLLLVIPCLPMFSLGPWVST